MSFTEKRKSLRIPITTKVQFEKDGQEHVFFTDNLSRGGFQINVETPPYVGTMIKVELSLPNVEKLIDAKCEVVWRQEGKGCGVKFKQITKTNQALLDEFLEEQKD